MRLRPFGPDFLADLALLQDLDQNGPQAKTQEEGRAPGQGGPDRDVAEDIEKKPLFAEGHEQPVKHVTSPSGYL
jgi:hypothetical protein